MNSYDKNEEVIYCGDDGEYGVPCNICDMLCMKRFYKNYLKSSTHPTILRKKTTIKQLLMFFLKVTDNCDNIKNIKCLNNESNIDIYLPKIVPTIPCG